MTKEIYVNNGIGFLSADVTSSATTLNLSTTALFSATGNYRVKIDNEIMLVTAGTIATPGTLTVTRAQEGTTGSAHTQGSVVFGVLTDGSLRSLARQSHGGTNVSARREINLVDGGGVTWTLTDDGTNDKVDISAAVGGGFEHALTPPPASSTFTWVNQGSATVTDDSAGFYLLAPAAAGNSMKMLVKTAPAAPYTLVAKIIPTVWVGKSNAAGLVLRDSVSGKIVRLAFNDHYVIFDKLTNETTYSAGYTSLDISGLMLRCTWLKIVDDNTNRIVSASLDGIYWHQIDSHARTDFITPDQIGVCSESNDGTFEAASRLVSWAVS